MATKKYVGSTSLAKVWEIICDTFALKSEVEDAAADASSALTTAQSAHSVASNTQTAMSALAPRVTALEGEYALANISSQSGNEQAQFYAHSNTATLALGNDTTPSGTWGSKTLCTIPEGYRPQMTCYYPVAKTGSAQSMSYVMVDTSTGVVTLQNWGGTQSSVNYFCTCTWAY